VARLAAHPTAADQLPAAAQVQIDAMTITQRPMDALLSELSAQGRAAGQMADPGQSRKPRARFSER